MILGKLFSISSIVCVLKIGVRLMRWFGLGFEGLVVGGCGCEDVGVFMGGSGDVYGNGLVVF